MVSLLLDSFYSGQVYAEVKTAPGYKVEVAEIDNDSTVVPDVETAAEGTVVTLTIQAELGYVLKSLTVTADVDTTSVDTTANMDAAGTTGTYSFTMPASNVTVSAEFITVEAVWGTDADSISYAGDFSAALNAAKEDKSVSYIMLMQDVTDNSYTVAPLSEELTINLNGKKLQNSDTEAEAVLTLTANTVNIIDTDGSGQIVSENGTAIMVKDSCTVNIADGTFVAGTDFSTDGTGTVLLYVDADGEGAVFVDGIVVDGTTLDAILDESAAYYQNGLAISIEDIENETSITNGDVRISYRPAVYDETNNVYSVYNEGQLFWIANLVNKTAETETFTSNVIIEDNITLTNPWTPIGLNANGYSGNFDGQNHTISGMKIAQTADYANTGLFAYVREGGVQNLNVKGEITLYNEDTNYEFFYSGMLAGKVKDSLIYNCKVSGEIEYTVSSGNGEDVSIGGLIGIGQHSVVLNCGADVNIIAENQGEAYTYAGGLVGYMTAGYYEPGPYGVECILNCYASGDITANGEKAVYFGGIAGYLSDHAVNNYFNGTINTEATSNIGYLFGYVSNTIHPIDDKTETVKINLIVENNYYPDGKNDIGNTSISTDCTLGTNYPFTVEELASTGESGLTAKLNGNLSAVQNIIDKHFQQIADSNWNFMIDKVNGSAVKAFPWKLDSDKGQPVHGSENDFSSDITLYGRSLTLEGNIGLNLYFSIPETILKTDGAYVSIGAEDGSSINIPLSEGRKNTSTGNTLYGYTCELNAKQMTDTVTACVIAGDQISPIYTLTIEEYAQAVLKSDKYDETLKELVTAMLNYGAYAQTYFNYNTDNLANAGLDEGAKVNFDEFDDSVFDSYEVTHVSVDGFGEFTGASLALESTTTLRVYFKPVEGVSDLTFTVDGESVTAETDDDGNYVISIENIAAPDMDKTFEVSVNGSSEKFAPCALSYCWSVMQQKTDEVTYTADLKNVLRAMYLYNIAADAYFNPANGN